MDGEKELTQEELAAVLRAALRGAAHPVRLKEVLLEGPAAELIQKLGADPETLAASLCDSRTLTAFLESPEAAALLRELLNKGNFGDG